MVYGKFVSQGNGLDLFHDIYIKVFTEELSVDLSDSMADEFYMNALVYAEGEPAGIGRIMYDGDQFTISDVAVLPQYRRQLYGDFMVRLLIDKAAMSNAQEVYLDAIAGTEEFFAKIGFEKEGALYQRGGCKWQPMKLVITNLHTCCNCKH